MDYIENIREKSLITFNIPKLYDYINKLEYLEYFSIGLELWKNHAMVDYEVITTELPTYKINNKGYMYIYLPGDRITDTAYLSAYKKILNIAKRNKMRKLVVSITTHIPDLSKTLTLLYPFLNNEHLLNLYQNNSDDIAAELHVIRGNAFYYFPKIKKESSPHMKIDSLNIKLPYDELVIRSHQELLGVFQLFRENPKVTIYLSSFNKFIPLGKISLRLVTPDVDKNRVLIILKYNTINKNNSAYKLITNGPFPEKYLPNA